ncbi:MAG: GNAT family protein [Candidatus Hydrogenedentota bacterium]
MIKHYIEGKRIYLRNVTLSDVTDRYCSWMNDEQVVQYLESRFSKYTKKDLILYVKKIAANPDILFLAIIVKKGNLHIGNVKLGPINRMHFFADMGIMIGDKRHWGKGYATETIKLIVNYAFKKLNLHKITAGIYDVNVGSEKVFLKAGFRKEGVLKKHYLYKNKFIDGTLWGIINKNFKR